MHEKTLQFLVDKEPIKILLKYPGAAELTSKLSRDTCIICGEPECYFSCDESQAQDYEAVDTLKCAMYNTAVDMLEAIVLAHAANGLLFQTNPRFGLKRYVEGLNTALEAAANKIYG